MLKILNLMDYSLLLCIESNPDYVQALNDGIISARTNCDRNSISDENSLSQDSSKDRSGSRAHSRCLSSATQDLEYLELKFVGTRNTFLSVDGKQVYHLGIIDYLQDFNLEKTAECYAKKSINKRGAEISAVPPRDYAPRFLNFMREKVLIDQKEAIDKS